MSIHNWRANVNVLIRHGLALLAIALLPGDNFATLMALQPMLDAFSVRRYAPGRVFRAGFAACAFERPMYHAALIVTAILSAGSSIHVRAWNLMPPARLVLALSNENKSHERAR